MEYVAAITSALSDPLRLRALALIAGEGELCVCELTFALQVSQPTMSKHLATLRDAGLVRDRRDAQWVLYALSVDLPDWAITLRASAMQGVEQTDEHRGDRRRLSEMVRPSKLRSA